jgi:hypothetical protein
LTNHARRNPSGKVVCQYGCEISLDNPVSTWLYSLNLECVYVGDCDWIVYKYGHRFSPELGIDRHVRWHMIVEIKTEDKDPDRSQAETLAVTNHLLRNIRWPSEAEGGVTGQFKPGHECNAVIREMDLTPYGGEPKTLIYSYGAQLLQLSGRSPTTSERIRWNRHEVTLTELRELLNFQRNPLSRQPMRLSMHKAAHEPLPTLFDDGSP